MTAAVKGPLRTILDVLIPATGAYGRKKVLLECGHKVWTGDHAIYRARCRHCKAAAQQGPAGVKTCPVHPLHTVPCERCAMVSEESASGVAPVPAPSGPLAQAVAGMQALDAGHDPLCMAVLRGKGCTCGVGGTSNG